MNWNCLYSVSIHRKWNYIQIDDQEQKRSSGGELFIVTTRQPWLNSLNFSSFQGTSVVPQDRQTKTLKVTCCITSAFRRFFFQLFFINNIYHNISSKSLKGSSRELTLYVFNINLPNASGRVCLLAPPLSGTVPNAYLLLTRAQFYFIIRYCNLPCDINCTIRFVDMSILNSVYKYKIYGWKKLYEPCTINKFLEMMIIHLSKCLKQTYGYDKSVICMGCRNCTLF